MSGADPEDSRHYAVRRVNPFEGVLQVVETVDARAYSPNGDIWQIQVMARRPDHTWRSFSDVPAIEQFFNFGLWDPREGLHRIPANPVMDIGAMSNAADRLAAVLQMLLPQLPFALVDDFECWSTDHRGNPVALLATTEDRDRIADLRPGRWQAARLADHGFVSPSLAAQGVPTRGEFGPRQHAEQLEGLVRRLGQHKTWFQRQPDGSGNPLSPAHEGTSAGNPELPALGIRTDWEDAQAQALVLDYLAWRSPQLLTLQAIDDTQRSWLEPLACRQAVGLAASYALIPCVLDQAAIAAARVEAKLRRAAR